MVEDCHIEDEDIEVCDYSDRARNQTRDIEPPKGMIHKVTGNLGREDRDFLSG